MATTSIWRVNGWLGKVVIYVENPDKTTTPAFYEKQDMTDRQTQGLSDVMTQKRKQFRSTEVFSTQQNAAN